MKKKEELRKEYGFVENDFILIYVGELSFRKHQDHLIEAVSKLKNKIPNVKLLLVGNGDLYDHYKDLVKQLEVEEQVQLLGYRKDVHKLMTISDIAVSTSRQEGLPVNVMEAMATQLPVVVTDCRGNRDLVSHGVNGFVVGINDIDASASAIEELYYSERLRFQFATNNGKLVQSYSIKQVLTEMEMVYKLPTTKSVTHSLFVNPN